ncbi:MAG: sodium ion-translocating decarboxylase subunit beta [Kiritimatiellia bacterium]|jgi:sodium ion-translocating decarboxylase beta subunit
MKKLLLSLLGVAVLAGFALSAPVMDVDVELPDAPQAQDAVADGHLSTEELLVRAKNIWQDTGIYGFMLREAPDWITKGYTRKDGQYVPGHEVEILGGVPYGVGQMIMIPICLILIYLAIVKGFEPLLLLPIGMGGLLANIPFAGVTTPEMLGVGKMTAEQIASATISPGGFLYYLFSFGVDSGLFPIIIFMGVGAMTDFGPLIANPKTCLLGAAAQLGIFFALIGAVTLSAFVPGINFSLQDAASIGIIGGADGPTAIWLTTKLAPDLLGAIAVAAYSYMALVPIIQPPLMKLCTTDAERKIKMKQLRDVKKIEKVVFPLVVILLCGLLLPSAVPLMGALMFGNLARECKVVDRIADTMENALMNIVTICLGLSVGSKLAAEKFLTLETLGILLLGLCAFAVGTMGGVWMARIMNFFSKEKINPLIGSAGVSAVPMAARVSNKVGQEYDPSNFLLMHAMGPNVSGVIGSAVVAGILYRMLG